MSEHEWRIFAAGAAWGLNRGHLDEQALADARAEASCRVAAGMMRRASTTPQVHPEFLTATDDELVAMAAERERRGIERFRAALGRPA